MKTMRVILMMSLLAIFLLPVAQVLAGGEPPPTTGTIQGPELWGVFVFDCNTSTMNVRIKRVVNCQVETQALVVSSQNCPTDETQPLWETLEIQLFDINQDPATLTPIITKVKNFKTEVNVVSFDAQIKFWSH